MLTVVKKLRCTHPKVFTPKECLKHKRVRRIRDRDLRVKGVSRRKKWGDGRRNRDLFTETMIASPETAVPLPQVEGNIYAQVHHQHW